MERDDSWHCITISVLILPKSCWRNWEKQQSKCHLMVESLKVKQLYPIKEKSPVLGGGAWPGNTVPRPLHRGGCYMTFSTQVYRTHGIFSACSPHPFPRLGLGSAWGEFCAFQTLRIKMLGLERVAVGSHWNVQWLLIGFICWVCFSSYLFKFDWLHVT